MNWQSKSDLDTVHHIAIEVDDIMASLDWYSEKFNCRIEYQDETWALLEFGNMSLALVTKGQHPRHIGFVTNEALNHGELKTHRDETRSIYVSDPSGNAVELLDPDSVTVVHSLAKTR
jgi:extradiol dioxygenase family protein